MRRCGWIARYAHMSYINRTRVAEKEGHMDRDFILKKAKKIMLKDGEHNPLLIVSTQDQPYIMPVVSDKWNTNNFGRAKLLFLMGREFAQVECITPDMLSDAYLVHEAWFVMRKVGEDLPDQPSQCADRQECLGVLELKINQSDRSVSQTYLQSEILRRGGIIDLALPLVKMDEAHSNLLTSFLAGVASAKYDDDEFGKVIERFAEVGGNLIASNSASCYTEDCVCTQMMINLGTQSI